MTFSLDRLAGPVAAVHDDAFSFGLDGSERPKGFVVPDLPMAPAFRFGIPTDEFAWRDDRMHLLGKVSAGTLLFVQRDLSDFRDLAGQRFFRPTSVPGFMVTPIDALPMDVGVGLALAFNEHDVSSPFLGYGYFATGAIDFRF